MELQYHHHQKIDSTQDWAKENYKTFDTKKMHVISASQQSKGRGRFHRHWHSPKGAGLYTTFCFFTEKLDFPFAPISLVTGLVFAEVLQKLGLKVQLKWPNDLYVHGKKIGGILTEVQEHEGQHVFFVGVGLNVNMSADELTHIDCPATSIFVETQKNLSIKAVAQPAEITFVRDMKIFLEKGFRPFMNDYEEISFLAGKQVLLDTGKEVIEAKYHHVREDGALVLEKNGKQTAYVSGEIKNWK